MVSPETAMLSVFMTPWTKPTCIHRATSAACRATTPSRKAAAGTAARAASGSCRAMAWSASRRTASVSPRAAKNWNVPTRMWLAATRARTAPGSSVSRYTVSPVATAARARVVGMPRAAMASLTRYSRSTGPRAARPSPEREKGVRPEPLSWMSRRAPSRPITSPRRIARPSPSCGEKPPN